MAQIMTLYYVETKGYFTTKTGMEYQQADGGCPPILYHTEKAAIERANKIVNQLVSSGCYQPTLNDEDYPKSTGYLLWATRLEWTQYRYEVRVYKIFTHTKQ